MCINTLKYETFEIFVFGGKLNEQFRKNIVPYMSKIVYYPDCSDLFNIAECDGLSYYVISKNKYIEKLIVNKSNMQKSLNSSINRNLKYSLWNTAESIYNKLSTFKTLNFNNKGNYYVVTGKLISFGGDRKMGTLLFSRQGNLVVLKPTSVTNSNAYTKINGYDIINRFNTEDQAHSFVLYINTKLIRFLILSRVTGYSHMLSEETWRFIPDQQDWSLVYEDKPLPNYVPDENGIYIDNDNNKHCSLYKKYNLTDEEINIIESVIKERK